MKTLFFWMIALFALFSAACAAETHTVTPETEVAVTAQPLTTQQVVDAMNAYCATNQCQVSDLQREDVMPGIAHYSWDFRVGSGTYDVIGMDRIVQEHAEWVPKYSSKAAFLAHGDTLNFRSAFLIGHDGTMASSVSGYLAAAGVDVWGITQRDRMVPGSVMDTSFMAPWNLETYVSDTRKAMYFARGWRALTLTGFGKFHFLGWSRGGQVAYVAAQQESQLSDTGWNRSMKSMTIVDVPLKTDDEAFRATICYGVIPQIQAARAAGQYSDNGGVLLGMAGGLALADPNGITPLGAFVPPLTGLQNAQVGNLFGGATWNLIPYLPWYHMTGAFLTSDDAMGFPLAFRYTDETVFYSVMAAVSPYEANGVMEQGAQVICDDSTTIDDHLGDVELPTLYLGMNGGFGDLGFYTTSLLGTDPDDIHLINIVKTGNKFTDFAHDDCFRSPEAEGDVYEPFLQHVIDYN